MEILRSLDTFKKLSSSVLTIGSYDGIHRGHREILTTLVHNAYARKMKSVLVTFDPHPKQVIGLDGKKLALIMSIEEKMAMFKKIGIDIVYLINFTKTFSKTSAKDFLDDIIMPFFSPELIITGYDHHFGNKREGSPSFLMDFCSKNSIGLDIVEPISDDGHILSSSRIRKLIEQGYVRRANFELGFVYGFMGLVIKGSGRGRDLNFPTANIVPVEKYQLMPKTGVYFIRGRINGQNAFGMCNFGTRPTFNESELVMEIHFFHDDYFNLYGKKIRVEFLERIRDETKFPSPESLKEQLEIDKQVCLNLKGKYE